MKKPRAEGRAIRARLEPGWLSVAALVEAGH